MQMMKRALLLNGVAIVGVLINHALYWVHLVMIGWPNVYSNVAIPNYDQVGTFSYYVWLILQQLHTFSVPSFVFVTGFFFAFMSQGHKRPDVKVMKKKMSNLIIPYLIWSFIIILGNVLSGQSKSGLTYLAELVSVGVYDPYYYVPLLIQLYVVAFLLSPLVVKSPWKCLAVAAFVQLGVVGIKYLNLVWATPVLAWLQRITPYWTFPHYLFFLALGFVVYLKGSEVKAFVQRRRGLILVTTIIAALFTIVEPEFLFRTRGVDWRTSVTTFSGNFYGTLFVFWFLSIKSIPKSLSLQMQNMAGKSYGIYLVHGPIMGVVVRVLDRFLPWVLGQYLLLGVIVFVASLAGSLILIEAVKRTPLRKAYRFLFG